MEIKNTRASANLAMLEFVAEKLASLRDDFVFLGGSATAIFIDDPVAPDIRTTLDVDCIVDVLSLGQYHKIEKDLMAKGFKKSMEDEVICRWHYDDVILDVMPTDERILGFSNRWYKAAIQNFSTYKIKRGLMIKTVTAPYFLATKLEAFKTRGKKDYLSSHDLEDIITVIDGRLDLMKEIELSELELRNYLKAEFLNFLQDPNFSAYLPGHLNYGAVTMARAKLVLDRIKKIANLSLD